MHLPIITHPNPLLRQTSEVVTEINDDIRKIFNDMHDTMRVSEGIGISAVQVGILKRLVVIDLKDTSLHRHFYKMVNPEIIKISEDKRTYNEGCLSVPHIGIEIERANTITVKFQDEYGIVQQIDCSGLLATCVQHEIDHLNGVTMLEHVSRLRRDILIRKMHKISKS